MANDGALGAIERMESALRRIEAAAERLKSQPDAAALAERHERLQRDVEAAIEGLDQLLAAEAR